MIILNIILQKMNSSASLSYFILINIENEEYVCMVCAYVCMYAHIHLHGPDFKYYLLRKINSQPRQHNKEVVLYAY